ncbi:MAG: YceH family protein [Holophagales bacterium]|nr:YceH family protein [Holophagales bacterium]
MPPTRPLDFEETRVLGALMEKEQTTPDHYPMTINALIAACNQKTNRDPVTQLSETEVVEALDRLRLDALTWRSEGARAERWEHRLDRRWHLTPQRKAILTLMLLRGPQTAGELKTRADRIHHFDSVQEVLETLGDLAGEGEEAFVRELPRQPGQRENRWMHLAGDESVEAALAAAPAAAQVTAPTPRVDDRPRGPSASDRLELLEGKFEGLEETVESLLDDVTKLRAELHGLRRRLGDLEE